MFPSTKKKNLSFEKIEVQSNVVEKGGECEKKMVEIKIMLQEKHM